MKPIRDAKYSWYTILRGNLAANFEWLIDNKLMMPKLKMTRK